jgi:nucleoside-diphosphate-sugar epimerase
MRKFIEAGYDVRGLKRDTIAALKKISFDMEWIRGGIRESDSLGASISGVDFIQCAVGARQPFGPNRLEILEYLGVTNLVDEAKEAGVDLEVCRGRLFAAIRAMVCRRATTTASR